MLFRNHIGHLRKVFETARSRPCLIHSPQSAVRSPQFTVRSPQSGQFAVRCPHPIIYTDVNKNRETASSA